MSQFTNMKSASFELLRLSPPALLAMALSLITVVSAPAAGKQPNFVFILGEAQGWSALSTQMDPNNPQSKSDFFYTPNLAKVAEQGMRFSRFYAPSPRCTPSRATYFTGISPAALHMTFVSTADSGGRVRMPNSSTEMPLEVTTIAERLKTAGYTTAHFGKWHVGRTSPARHGFDEHDGANSNSGPENAAHPNPKQFYLTAEKGIDFMTRSVTAGKPFYLQVSHYGGKSALDCKPETMALMRERVGSRDLKNLGAAAVALDADLSTGQILAAIERLGISDNTYFFYTADHGTQGRNGPLANGKGSVREGGIRVPLIFRGPGIRPGSYADMLTTGADLFPTLSELAGITEPAAKAVEGGSLAAVLHGRGQAAVKRPRTEFVVHFPHYDKDPLGPASSIHLGEFKAVRYFERDEWHLYNLKNDLGERNNLAARMPEKLAELRGRMTEYLKALKAQIPVIDSSRPVGAGTAPRGGQGGNRPSEILTALDVDQDGKVTPAEMQNAAAVLMKFDRDRDGKLTEDEIRRGTRGGGRRER
jgi:arylsulfatase A